MFVKECANKCNAISLASYTASATYAHKLQFAKLIIFRKWNTLLTMFIKADTSIKLLHHPNQNNFNAFNNFCVAPLLLATYLPAASPAFLSMAASEVKAFIICSNPA